MTEEKYLREYIYIDTTEVNSLLAQFHEGLETAIKKTDNFSSTATTGHSFSADHKLGGGFSGLGIAKAESSAGQTSKESTSSSNTNNLGTTTESIYSDYAVEVLESELANSDLLQKDLDSAELGEVIKSTIKLDILDFEHLSAIIDPAFLNQFFPYTDESQRINELEQKVRHLKKQSKKANSTIIRNQINEAQAEIKELKKINSSSEEGINSLHALSSFGSTVFKDTLLLKGPTVAAYAKSSNFRMNKSQLSMLTNTNRKATIIGIAENRFKRENPEELFGTFNPTDVGKLSYAMSNMILTSFDLINDNALLIKPLAIYFE